MQTKHYALLTALLVSFGMQLSSGVHGWHELATPMFVGGMLVQIGTVIAAVFQEKP